MVLAENRCEKTKTPCISLGYAYLVQTTTHFRLDFGQQNSTVSTLRICKKVLKQFKNFLNLQIDPKFDEEQPPGGFKGRRGPEQIQKRFN